MTLPALWIRQNMLQSPGPFYNSNERPLTEAEIKVQRSLKKLSIPEWYLNNSSHPPKILMNDTPIDMRPPSWKEQKVNNSIVCSTPIMQVRHSTVNRDGVLETEIGPPMSQNQYYRTFKINRSSIGNRSPLSKKRSPPQKSQARQKESPRSRILNVSRTFPRISPSRKIQNINIVFPQPERSSHSHTVTDLDASDPEIEMSEDSLELNRVIEPTIRTPHSLMITDLDRTEPEIGMIGNSLIVQHGDVNHRRVQSPEIHSDSCRVNDLDCTESEIGMIGNSSIIQPGERNDRPLQSPQIHSDSYKVTDLNRTKPEIGAIGNSLIIQPGETNDRRLPSSQIDSDISRITDIDSTDLEIQPGKTNDRRLQSPQIVSDSYRITDLDRTEPEIGIIGHSSINQPGKTNDQRPQCPQIHSDSYKLTGLDDPSPLTPEIKDSSWCPDRGTQIVESANRTIDTSTVSDAILESNSFDTRVRRIPNRQLTYIKPWKATLRPEVRSCVTPEGKFTSAVNFKLRAASTPQGSPVSVFLASTIENATPADNRQEPTSGFTISPSEEREKSPSSTNATNSKTPEEDEMCDACRADQSKSKQSTSPNCRPSSGFRPRNLLPPIGETLSYGSSASVVPLSSKKKSSEFEGMIKRTAPQPGKSLVQEIIEELNEKCRSSAQPTYVSPGSKNFVKKLVKALEKGKTPSIPEDDEDASYQRFAGADDYEEYDYSEDDAKSAAVSTSISYKDTDSSSTGSDTDLRSPTVKIGYNYGCNIYVEKNGNDQMGTSTIGMVTSTPDFEEKENDSVYWIPIAKSKLPRTSSLLTMMSRLSTTNPGHQSPCVSPIKQTADHRQNIWGTTFKTSEQHRTLRRIDETTILDSGYSDRSRVRSSESSDDTWFDDTESTWTASETGSLSSMSFSLGSRLRPDRQQTGIQIYGRPFVI